MIDVLVGNNSHSAKDVLDTHGSLVQLIQEVPFKRGKVHLSARHLSTYYHLNEGASLFGLGQP